MNSIIIIAEKEWEDILHNKVFTFIVVMLAILTVTSLIVSFLVFNNQSGEYRQALDMLKQLGKRPAIPPPKLYPLNLLRGVVDYIEIVGAILGMLLGYISISKERNTRALDLILTRPVKKRDIVFGKILGNIIYVVVLMSIVCVITVLSIYLIGGVTLNRLALFKILLFGLISTIYILLFFLLSIFFSLSSKTMSHALIFSFITWLVIVLILPQVGDTMDPDNQVPGGFFKSMSLNKAQEKQVLAKFSGYEARRGFIEQLSITKHYERFSFAIFGIKKIYNDKSLSTILHDKAGDILWIILSTITVFLADCLLMVKRPYCLEGD
ncbi:MAG: ABC transporter permease subunit [Deltaproteobacteria bacterium]|nr:ABC transporter permease subunit [Deltaproteobacteria bacterium]